MAQAPIAATSKATDNNTVPTLLDMAAPAFRSGAVGFPEDELVGLMQKLVVLPLDAKLVFAGLHTRADAVSGDVATIAKVPLIMPISQPNGVHASTGVLSRSLFSHPEKIPCVHLYVGVKPIYPDEPALIVYVVFSTAPTSVVLKGYPVALLMSWKAQSVIGSVKFVVRWSVTEPPTGTEQSEVPLQTTP
jgi:hypothetical protein